MCVCVCVCVYTHTHTHTHTQEKLAKAHEQLIETLKEELQAGAVSLEKSKKLVGTFNETGQVGLSLVREAGETKMCEIRAHMAKIRQILDDKEKIALETVENEMKRRLAVLHSEVSVYGTVVPDLGGKKFSKVL
jgi:hypothetical protein